MLSFPEHSLKMLKWHPCHWCCLLLLHTMATLLTKCKFRDNDLYLERLGLLQNGSCIIHILHLSPGLLATACDNTQAIQEVQVCMLQTPGNFINVENHSKVPGDSWESPKVRLHQSQPTLV